MSEKKTWLVQTTEKDSEWEVVGGAYIVEAENHDEIRKMKFGFQEKIVSITNIKHLDFGASGIFTIHEAMQL